LAEIWRFAYLSFYIRNIIIPEPGHRTAAMPRIGYFCERYLKKRLHFEHQAKCWVFSTVFFALLPKNINSDLCKKVA